MKKILLTSVAIMAMMAALVGCGKCEHTFSEATCQTLATCTQCGETTGELAEHKWVEATCQAPKTCSVCGLSEGDVVSHDYEPATLQAPKTCKLCGATEGSPLTLSVVDYDYDLSEKYNGQHNWGATSQDVFVGYLFDFDRDGAVWMEFTDVDGNTVNEFYLPDNEGLFTYAAVDHANYYCITCTVWSDDGDPGFCIIICDAKGNELFREDYFTWELDLDHLIDLFWNDMFYISPDTSTKNLGYIEFYDGEEILRAAYDMKNNVLISAAEYAPSAMPIAEGDEVYYCDEINNLILVERDEKYAVLDRSGNTIMDGLADFSGFNADGYALISRDNDRSTYDLINLDFEIVAENVLPGCENAFTRGGNLFINRYDGVDKIQELVIE